LYQEEAQAFIYSIPGSVICIWIYNFIENKVDYLDRSYFSAIFLAPYALSGFLALVGSWIYIYKIKTDVDYGISPLDDWIALIFPMFTYCLGAISLGYLAWGVWKLIVRYK